MKNHQLKLFFLVLLTMMAISTALGKDYFLGRHDIEPGQKGENKEVVNVAMNIGKIVGIILLTDESLIDGNSYGLNMHSLSGRSYMSRGNNGFSILFGLIGLIFLAINIYYGSKIIEFLKSRGKKAHYWAFRWMVFSYVSQYKKITEEEEGHTGPYYLTMGITAFLMIIFLTIAIVFTII